MNTGLVNDFLILLAPFSAVPASVSNNNAKWGIKMVGGSTDSPNALEKSACIYAVSEEDIGAGGSGAGYNRKVGLALHTSPFDLPNVERVRINNLGNVGIGTTGPVTLLNIRASAPTTTGTVPTGTNLLIDSNTSNYITFRNTADNGTYAGLIFLDNNVGGYITFGNSGAAVGSDSMIYGTFNDHIFQNGYINETLYNRTETMRIKQNGNVGIGTTVPRQILHLNGSILLDGIQNGYEQGATRAIGYGSNSGAVSADGFSGMDIQSVNAGGNYSQNLRFWTHHYGTGTGGTPRMFLQYNGNLGIGTTSPTYKLQIGTVGSLADSIRIGTYQVAKNTRQYIGYTRDDSGLFESAGNGDTPSTVLGGVVGIRIVNTEGTLYAPQADNSVQILTHIYNGGSRVALHAHYDGNVGIGTTTPTGTYGKLSVAGGIRILDDNNAKLEIGRYSSGASNSYIKLGSNSNSLRIANNTDAADIFTIENGGNVGIGTTVPVARLHVASTTAAATLLRADGTSGTLFSVVDDLSDSLMSVNNSAGLPVLEVFADDRIVMGQYGQNDFVVVNNKVGIGTNNPLAELHVTSSTSIPSAIFMGGNVGIGTSSPGVALHVERSSGDSTATFKATSGGAEINLDATNGYAALKLYSSGTEKWRVGQVGDSTGFQIFQGGIGNRVYINSSGNVGIGTTVPSVLLDVSGSLKCTGKFVQHSTTQSITGTNQTMSLNVASAAVHIVSMASGATITTISYSNRDNNPAVNTLMLVVKYAGTASITFTSVIWANDVVPTLTGTNGYADVFMLTSYKGGAGTPVWIGTVVAQGLVSTNL